VGGIESFIKKNSKERLKKDDFNLFRKRKGTEAQSEEARRGDAIKHRGGKVRTTAEGKAGVVEKEVNGKKRGQRSTYKKKNGPSRKTEREGGKPP